MTTPEIAKRLSTAEKRLKRIEAMIGVDTATTELSDFPPRHEWLPGDSSCAEHESDRVGWHSPD